MKKKKDYIDLAVILLMCITSLVGVLSMDFSHAHDFVNQYNQTVSLYGYGIYAHDSYLKGAISVGTDYCILFVFVPIFIYTVIKYLKDSSEINELKMVSVHGVALYYSASLTFGVTYNRLFLVYAALFSCSLFVMFVHIRSVNIKKTAELNKGVKMFLVLTGLALFAAWLPDIIPSLISGGTLSGIGVYTTEITYVIDMGIVSPLCFLCIYLLSKKDSLGNIILAVMYKLCIVVAVMMIPQSVCIMKAGIDMPLPALITKTLSFVVLGGFGYYFNKRMYKEIAVSIK